MKIYDVYEELTRGLKFYESDIFEAKKQEFLENDTNKDENGKKLTKDAQKLKYENFVKQAGEEIITVDEAIEKYLKNAAYWPKTQIQNTYAEAIALDKARRISSYLFKKHDLSPENGIIDFDVIFKEMTYGSTKEMKDQLEQTRNEQYLEHKNNVHISLMNIVISMWDKDKLDEMFEKRR